MLPVKAQPFAFIVGSPRSGTTLLGEMLDRHKDICQWYEPYFVWDRHFRDNPHDERTSHDATPRVRRQIHNDFVNFKRVMGSKLVVDKSPRNSLRVPFIQRIFPHARFINMTRDGRDVTLSIHKEWIRRRQIIKDADNETSLDYKRAYGVLYKWLRRQPTLRYKVRALWFETHGHLLSGSKHLNRLRWNGSVGWGPRFRNWEDVLKKSSLLEFSAYQWAKCVHNIHINWHAIPEQNRLMIRYEDLLKDGEGVIMRILEFLTLGRYEGLLRSLPKLKSDNFNKWQKGFSKEQIREIHPILAPTLIELGYEDNPNWLNWGEGSTTSTSHNA